MTQVTHPDKAPRECGRGSGIAHNPRVQTYRFAPTVTARIVGLAFIALAVYIFVGVMVVSVTGGGMAAIFAILAVGLVAVGLFAWWLLARAYVVRCTADGYRIGLVRGAGVKRASWREVENATADTVRGIQLLVLHLSGGRRTSIPVAVLATDKEQFVREMQRHLASGQGVTRI